MRQTDGRAERSIAYNKTVSILSGITALTLPASRCALAPAADIDRKAAAIDGTDRRTDGHPTVM